MSKVQFKSRAVTEAIFVHCSATKASMNVGLREIRQWHKEQGWLDVGYHFIIRRDGTIEEGRPVDVVGSHVKDWNSKSVGVCLVGGIDDKGNMADTRTDAQKTTLRTLLVALLRKYPVPIYGHRHFDNGKVCPCFDADTEYKGLLQCVPVLPDLAKPSVSFT